MRKMKQIKVKIQIKWIEGTLPRRRITFGQHYIFSLHIMLSLEMMLSHLLTSSLTLSTVHFIQHIIYELEQLWKLNLNSKLEIWTQTFSWFSNIQLFSTKIAKFLNVLLKHLISSDSSGFTFSHLEVKFKEENKCRKSIRTNWKTKIF